MTSAREALHSSQSVEWYSPSEIVEPVRIVLGGRIGLDPASCELANAIVKAEKFYDIETDGLSKQWDDDWFLNPPYKIGITEKWVDYCISQHYKHQHTSGLLLVNATPDRSWFWPLWQFPVCFLYKRIRFLETPAQRYARMFKNIQNVPVYKGETFADGRLLRGPQPTNGNAIVYLGEKYELFESNFTSLGHIAWPRHAR